MGLVQILLLLNSLAGARQELPICDVSTYKQMIFELLPVEDKNPALALFEFKEELEFNGFLIHQINFSKRRIYASVLEVESVLTYLESQRTQNQILNMTCLESTAE